MPTTPMHRLLALLSALVGAACLTTPERNDAPTDPAATAGVDATLDALHAAAAAADGEAYFALYTEDAVFLGTDATERWDLEAFRAYAEPHFAAGEGWTYVPLERHVTLAPGGDLAWFDERLANEAYGEARGSGVLRRAGDRWLVAQYVLSFPVPNERAAAVVALIRGG